MEREARGRVIVAEKLNGVFASETAPLWENHVLRPTDKCPYTDVDLGGMWCVGIPGRHFSMHETDGFSGLLKQPCD